MRLHLPSRRSSLLADRRGAAVVEFAIIAMPFFYLLFAIIEGGLMFVANSNVANATLNLARSIRVGAVVAPGISQTTSAAQLLDLADFKAAICARVNIVPTATCLQQIQVDIRTQSSFQNQTLPSPFSGKTFSNANFCYYSGNQNAVVVMRVFYLWPVQTPLLYSAMVGTTTVMNNGVTSTGNYVVLSSTEVFKNEPNSSTQNPGGGC